MLLGWETALGGMQFETEGKGPLGAGHILGVWPVFNGLSSLYVSSTFLFPKSCHLTVASPPLSNPRAPPCARFCSRHCGCSHEKMDRIQAFQDLSR